jgi:hypothetical protein
MIKIDPMSAAALKRAMEKAEPKLAAALIKHGVTSPDQLPSELASQIFQEAMVQTAIEHFPEAHIEELQHFFSAIQNRRFNSALATVRKELERPFDAFAMASGVDAGIVLAAFGLPVAPLDRKKPRILAMPSNKIDIVADTFSKWKTALVGYSPCDIPFYILLTDCVQTARLQIQVRPEMQEVRALLERAGAGIPAGPFRSFQHGMMLIPRAPGDTISSVFLDNRNPNEGSVALYAGWTVDGVREGVPNEGFVPVPLQFLAAGLDDPQIASWIWSPVGVRLALN